MSLINSLISGATSSQPLNWVAAVESGSLSGYVTPFQEGRNQCYRIDLRNHQTENLSGVAALIEQLYQNGVCRFELQGINSSSQAWNNLINRIGNSANENTPLELKIRVESAEKERTITDITKEYEDSFDGKVSFQLFHTAVNSPQPNKAKEKSQQFPSSTGVQIDEISEEDELAAQSYLLSLIHNLKSGKPIDLPPDLPLFKSMERNNQVNISEQPVQGDLFVDERLGEFSYHHTQNLLNQRVLSCVLEPTVEVFQDTSLVNEIVNKLKEKGVTYVLIANPTDDLPNDARIADFVLPFLNENCFTSVVFSNINMSQSDFEEIAGFAFSPQLQSVDFQCEIEGAEWTNTVPLLLDNCQNLMTFSCTSSTEVTSLDFLNNLITSGKSLTLIELVDLRFAPNVLIGWLMTNMNSTLSPRENELTIQMTMDPKTVNREDRGILNQTLEYFNANAAVKKIKIDVHIPGMY